MRRAGEIKLNEEVRALLESWQDDFNAAERIFIRGSVSAKKTFWGYDGAVVAKGASAWLQRIQRQLATRC
jgi:hypothetical protein